jgi:bifunctional DNase/RNase
MSAIRWKRGPSMAVKVVVESVRINLATNTRVVLLKDAKIDRYLLIHIGEWESFAIAAELQGHKPTRPFTHDLVMNMLGQLDARIESILIHSLKNDVFFATIVVDQGGRHLEIDARPSDSIALAVRCDAAIYVADDVFDQAGLKVSAKNEEDDKLAVFRDFVNQLDL